MANENNLIPNSERSPSEVRANGKKGGIASGKARRRKKCLQETAKMLLRLPIYEGNLDPLTSWEQIKDNNVTVEEKMILKQIQKALTGDINAFRAVIELVSENKPVNASVNLKAETKADDSFIEALKATASEVWNEGSKETDTV